MKVKILIFYFLIPFFAHAQVITTIAGIGMGPNSGDGGPATAAVINYPNVGAFDKQGNYYFVTGNNGHTVRKIAPSGIITTVAGITGVAGFSGDGGLADTAKLHNPQGIAIDTLGNIYISDNLNGRVRKVDISTGIITTIAGTGATAYSGDNGPPTAAAFYGPNGLCFDKKGNLYVADYENFRIRKISPSGIITTFAGTSTAGYNGDGGLADTSEIKGVFELCSDDTGNVYLADEGNGRVRKIDTLGIIHTIAGTGAAGYSGDGGQALNAEVEPHTINYDKFGNIYFSDIYANKVRVINSAGIIRLEAGTGVLGFSGDGGLADTAELKEPHGLSTDTCGNLYICDLDNYRIRKITFDTSCGKTDTTRTDTTNAVQNINAGGFSVYPNPATSEITITGNNINSVQVMDMFGQVVYNKELAQQKKLTIDISALPTGMYFIKVNETYVQKVLKE